MKLKKIVLIFVVELQLKLNTNGPSTSKMNVLSLARILVVAFDWIFTSVACARKIQCLIFVRINKAQTIFFSYRIVIQSCIFLL